MDKISLTDEEKIHFADQFLRKYLSAGFGAMSKREIDLLVFHLISEINAVKNSSRYDLSNILRISEKRIDSLKRDAAHRHKSIDHTLALLEIARIFFVACEVRLDVDEDTVHFRLDDPILRREFEHAVQETGYFVDYSFNRDVLRVKAHVFLSVFAKYFPKIEKSFIRVVKATEKKRSDADVILDKSLSLSQRLEKFLSRHRNKIELTKNILAPLASAVGGTA